MEDKTLNELQQIKIQGQIGDLKLQESKLKTKRRHAIGFILQLFAGLLAIAMVADLPFTLYLFMKWIFQLTGWGEIQAYDHPFSPLPFWWWFAGVIFLLIIVAALYISKLSKSISQLESDISKRYSKIKQLSEERYN